MISKNIIDLLEKRNNEYKNIENNKYRCQYESKQVIYEYIYNSNIVENNKNVEENEKCDKKISYNCCSLDIGGTLIKLAYLNNIYINTNNEDRYRLKNLGIKIENDKYLFVDFFSVNKLNEALNFIIKNNLIKDKKMILTGGGSYKYYYNIIEKIIHEHILKKFNIKNNEYILTISKYQYCEEISTLYIQLQLNRNHKINVSNQIKFDNIFLTNFGKYERLVIYIENFEKSKNNINKILNNDDVDEIKNNFIYNTELLLEVCRKDEMYCVINGIYKLFNVKKSIIKYDNILKAQIPIQIKSPLYPFIIANIGSGISILKSDSYNSFSRISGTSIGGGTVIGLATLIFGKISFDDLVKLSYKGNGNLDLKFKHLKNDVGDNECVKDNTLVSLFGLVNNILENNKENKDQTEQINQDIARSLILMVSYNIGYLVYLLAKIHSVKRIFFSGKYINNNEYIMESITKGVYYHFRHYNKTIENIGCFNNAPKNINKKNLFNNYDNIVDMSCYKLEVIKDDFHLRSYGQMSKDDTIPEVLFLKHDGFLGVIGGFFS
ncbi:pantothenate kinase, variant [Plasmodium yoelii 17X]|uniref:Pantothenate kinase n=1 Tax=Plasmodium yoelii 17X TaxID=1323249 RepID=V7PMS1_PLAYE|nr:pantothenate kinase [Plasmodium yoelii 17X]ETB59619.1 pantothenate kinase, variant [Plasmodium yoelii 17X]